MLKSHFSILISKVNSGKAITDSNQNSASVLLCGSSVYWVSNCNGFDAATYMSKVPLFFDKVK